MGFFQDIGSGISGAAGAIGNGVSSAVGGVGQLIFGQTPPTPQSQTNSISPQLQAMQQQQAQAAQNYATNLPSYENQQQNTATDSSRQQLAQTLAGTTAGTNANGLLYGSYNQGQQAQATAQNAANLQTTKANINTADQNTLASMQAAALGTGMAVNQSQQAENQTAYQTALAQQQNNTGLFNDLLQGAGKVTGLIAGG